ENIRLSQADVTGMRFSVAESTRLYADAFRAYGLDALALSPDDFGERLRQDPIHRALLAATLDWAFITRDVEEKQRLMQAVRVADPQLSALLDRWREAVAKRDRGTIHHLVATAEIPALPPVGWINLASIIFRVGAEDDGIQLLRSVQRQHENDFWVNHE